jgi:hypothetical protein
MKEQSLNVAIIVASVAFVSTILGATIGAVTNYVLAVRRERADKMRDARNHAIEVKRAARLIDVELSRAATAAQICLEKRHWWSRDVHPLTTEAWQTHNVTLASDLTDQAWLAIRIGIEAVDHIRLARDISIAAGLEEKAISDTTADSLAPMLKDIELGRDALAPLARDAFHAADK